MQNCLAHSRNKFYNTDGKVYPCCQYDQMIDYSTDHTFAGCHQCRTQQARGQPSLRETLNQDLVDQHSIEIAVDNTCNLTCVMCSSLASHGIAAREKKLYGRSAVMGQSINRIDFDSIDFEPVTRLRLYGGEPLYSPGAQRLISTVDPRNMQVILPTNATIIPNHEWQTWLARADSVTVDLSIDAWGDLNTYQRPGATWHTVHRTLDWWSKTNYTININATQTVYTVNHTHTLVQQIAQHYPHIHVHIGPIVSPAYLSIHNLPGVAAHLNCPVNHSQDLYDWFYTAHQHNTQSLHPVNPQLAEYIQRTPGNILTQRQMLELVMPQKREAPAPPKPHSG